MLGTTSAGTWNKSLSYPIAYNASSLVVRNKQMKKCSFSLKIKE